MKKRHSKSDDIYDRLVAVVRKEFNPGDQFMTVRQLALQEKVSLQTAMNLVNRLRKAGIVSQEAGKSPIVQTKPGQKPPYTVAVAIHQKSGWFSHRFLDGILEGLGDKVPPHRLKIIDPADLRSVPSLEAICRLNYEGIIAVAEAHPWALHFLNRNGMQVLTDQGSDVWPEMPVTTFDFAAAAREAGKLLARFGHTRVIIAGTSHKGASPSHFREGFGDGLVETTPDLWIAEGQSLFGTLLNNFKPTALYAANNPTLSWLLSDLHSHGLRIPDDISLVMHDANQEPYSGFGIVPISSVAPSIQTLGKALGMRMCRMIEEPEANEPTVQMLGPLVRVTGSVRQI